MQNKTCAVVGMGMLGTQHAGRLLNHPHTTLVAVCDIKKEKAQSWAEQNGVAWYADVKEMLAAHSPDLLVVATQDPYHKEPLLAACAHKTPYIICEKPLTTTLADALEVEKAAAASGTKIKVLFPNRFYPLDQSIRAMIAGGYLGAPQYGEARLDDAISVPLSLWGKDSKHYASISNPAYFLFSHAVDLLHFYFPGRRIKKVYAVGRQGTVGSDLDYIDSFLTFDDGMTFRLKTEWTKRMDTIVENYFQLTAAQGGFTFNKTPGFNCKQGLRLFFDDKTKADAAYALLCKNGVTATPFTYGEGDVSHGIDMAAADSGNDFDWNAGVCIYADSFDGEEPPLSPLTDLSEGIEQVRVVEALIHSAKEGREITL